MNISENSPSRTPTVPASRPRQPLLALGFLLAFGLAMETTAQERSQEPPPEPPSSTAPEEATSAEAEERPRTEPQSVAPPEGESDSWGFGSDASADGDGTETSLGDDPSTAEDVDSSDSRPREVKIVRARLRTEAGHRHVRGLKRLAEGAARGEISRQGDRMAYDKTTDLGVRGLYVGRLDGSYERCLSCENSAVRKKSVLSPTWHPSGKSIVAMVQGPARKLRMDTTRLATAARGLHTELWAFAIDGRDAWGLTRVVPQGGAVLDPVFSFEGNRLAWTERVSTTEGGRWGDWVVRVAEFRIKRGLPRLGDVETFEGPAWPGLVIAEGFTQDDRGLWLTTSPSAGSGKRGHQVGRLDLDSGEFHSIGGLGTWNEGIDGVPRSTRRIWLSDRDLDLPDRLPRINELWLRSETGRTQERLTFFNDPGSRDPLGEAWIADTSWSTDGRQLLLHILTPGLPGEVEEGLYLLELSPNLGER